MNRMTGFLVASIVAISLLVSAGPTLVGLAHAAVPVVIAVGAVVVAVRVVWHYTSRY